MLKESRGAAARNVIPAAYCVRHKKISRGRDTRYGSRNEMRPNNRFPSGFPSVPGVPSLKSGVVICHAALRAPPGVLSRQRGMLTYGIAHQTETLARFLQGRINLCTSKHSYSPGTCTVIFLLNQDNVIALYLDFALPGLLFAKPRVM